MAKRSDVAVESEVKVIDTFFSEEDDVTLRFLSVGRFFADVIDKNDQPRTYGPYQVRSKSDVDELPGRVRNALYAYYGGRLPFKTGGQGEFKPGVILACLAIVAIFLAIATHC